MVLNNVYQLRHIQLTKHMHYEYYTTQWNFIIFSKLNHMTVTSPKQKWMRVVEIVRRFVTFFYAGEKFTLIWWVILILRKWLQTSMHWQNPSFLTLSITFHLFFL